MAKDELPGLIDTEPDPDEKTRMFTISSMSSQTCFLTPSPLATVEATFTSGPNSWPESFIPDSGYSRTTISLATAEEQGLDYNKKHNISLRDAQGNLLKVEGMCKIRIQLETGEATSVNAIVSSTLHGRTLVGLPALKRLRIIHQNYPEPLYRKTEDEKEQANKEDHDALSVTKDKEPPPTGETLSKKEKKEKMELSQLKEKLLGEFDDVFSDKLMHQMEGKDMVIHLRPGHGEPYNRAYTRKIPVHHQDEAAKMIRR